MFSSMLDYNEKSLQVAIKDLRGRETDSEGFPRDNGLIYDLRKVFAKINDYAETIFGEFFEQGGIYRVAPVVAEAGPGELVKEFGKQFGIENTMCIGGIVAPFRATDEQAKTLLEELARNPEQFYTSAEKVMFG